MTATNILLASLMLAFPGSSSDERISNHREPSHSAQESSQRNSTDITEAAELSKSVVRLFNERKFDEALPLAKRALEIRENLIPRDELQIEAALNNLGDVYLAKGDFSFAKEVFLRLLGSREHRLGPDDVSLGPVLDRLAAAYFQERAFRKSEDSYKRSLSIREKKFGLDSEAVGQTLIYLGEYYRARGDFDHAAPILTRALKIFGQLNGAGSTGFENADEKLTCLAYESHKLDKLKELKELRERYRPSNYGDPKTALNEGSVLNGMALSLPRPPYPLAARQRGLSGTVIVKVMIDEGGKVIDARDMCQGPPYLTEVSLQSARLARFTPTKLSGMPVKVIGVVVYNFVKQ